MINLAQQLDADLAEVVKVAHRSLVHIHNGRRGRGAGTIWHPKGLIVTNAHVVGHGPVRVELPGGEVVPARILAQDRDRDLAALQIEADGLPAVALADSRKLRPGQWVVAVGHPWGVPGAATAGIVIGLDGGGSTESRPQQERVVVSLHMRPGHSGGPLVDGEGRLVGVNTMIQGPDVGVAIPVHVAVEFLRERLI